jgi:hypothetical protein
VTESVNEKNLPFRKGKVHLERILKYGGEIRNKKRALHFIFHVRSEVTDFSLKNLTLAQLVKKLSTFKVTVSPITVFERSQNFITEVTNQPIDRPTNQPTNLLTN